MTSNDRRTGKSRSDPATEKSRERGAAHCRKMQAQMIESEIWHSAYILLTRYGADAMLIAEKRADALWVQGDAQAGSAWLQIARAIGELERNSGPDSQMQQ